jgi:effector-binding domain-containing protein
MKYDVSLTQVESQYLAVVRATVNRQNLGATIREILTKSEIYTFIKNAGVEKAGHNVMVYHNDHNKPLGNQVYEFLLEVGVQVAGPFEGNGQVICSSTPEGTVATTLHTGPYHQLGLAHDAVQNWAKANHHPLTGLSWEVYGDWHEDPNQMTTELFYLLK